MKAQWEVGAKCGIRIPKTTTFEVQSFGRVEPYLPPCEALVKFKRLWWCLRMRGDTLYSRFHTFEEKRGNLMCKMPYYVAAEILPRVRHPPHTMNNPTHSFFRWRSTSGLPAHLCLLLGPPATLPLTESTATQEKFSLEMWAGCHFCWFWKSNYLQLFFIKPNNFS